MPPVRMPDGQIVEMPDNPTPDQLRRLRAVNDTSRPEAPGFLEGAKIGFDDPATAIDQLLGGVSDFMLTDKAKAAKQRSRDQRTADVTQYEQRRTAAGETGIDWSRLAGNVANPTTFLPAGVAGKTATTFGRIGQGATIGGITAPLTTPASPDAEGAGFIGQKAAQAGVGAVAGGAAPAIWQGAKAAGRTAINVIDPLLPGGGERAAGRLAVRMADAGGKHRDVIGELTSSTKSGQTAGQTAVPAGSAEFSALQKIADEAHPTPAATIKHAQEDTRTAALRSIGQDKRALESAKATRSADAEADYGAAFETIDKTGKIVPRVIKSDPVLENMLRRPSMDKVLGRAKDIAAERDKPFQIGVTAPAGERVDLIAGMSGQPGRVKTKATVAKFPVESLHFLKLAMDDLIKDPKTFGLGSTERAGIMATKEQFIGWLGGRVPQYEIARVGYAAASKPINQMQVGQFLEQKLAPALDVGQRPAAFAQAMRDAPGTIKKSTGGPRYEDLGDVLTSGQKNIADAVLANLQNDAKFNELAKMGMSSARKISGTFADPVRIPNLLNRVAMVVHNMVNRLEGRATKKTMESMSRLMNGDPKEMARIMESAAPYERRALMDAVMKYQAAVTGATAGQRTRDKRLVR